MQERCWRNIRTRLHRTPTPGFSQCCQLLAKLAGQSGRKIQPPKKMPALSWIWLFEGFCRGWWKFCYLCLRGWEKYNISWNVTELERIRGEKLIFKKFGPFSALSVQNRPKFGPVFTAVVLYAVCCLSWIKELKAWRKILKIGLKENLSSFICHSRWKFMWQRELYFLGGLARSCRY